MTAGTVADAAGAAAGTVPRTVAGAVADAAGAAAPACTALDVSPWPTDGCSSSCTGGGGAGGGGAGRRTWGSCFSFCGRLRLLRLSASGVTASRLLSPLTRVRDSFGLDVKCEAVLAPALFFVTATGRRRGAEALGAVLALSLGVIMGGSLSLGGSLNAAPSRSRSCVR